MAEPEDAVRLKEGAPETHRELSGGLARPGNPSLPVVATIGRWAAGSLGFGAALAAAAEGVLLFTHSSRAFATLAGPLALGAIAGAVVLFFVLRAEESQLARELRIARTGTPVLRSLIARRRAALPLFSRFTSNHLGAAAVLVADGDREGALDALSKTTSLMRAGRLETLRAIVEADVQRGSGTPGALEQSIRNLRATTAVGNRETDLYRLHVLAKAVLALGDGDAALELASELSSRQDDEERVYATWLRVWFDLDLDEGDADNADEVDLGASWPPISDGDLRVAALVARAQGAERLVAKLASRLSAIASSDPEG